VALSGDFEWQELRREPIDVLLAADHPLAQRAQLSFAELADEPFVLYGSGFALNSIILEACQESGFTPKVTARSSQLDFITELVAAKLGIAFFPRMIVEQRPHPLVRRIAVGRPAIYWRLAMIWRRGGYLSHAAQAWLALAGGSGTGSSDNTNPDF
jgi:DNA-binding transcriptional LysR family regulator